MGLGFSLSIKKVVSTMDQNFLDQIPNDLGPKAVCCLACHLVKTLDQFTLNGCENCKWSLQKNDRLRLDELTTTKFSGLTAIINPSKSRVAKLCYDSPLVIGIYAMTTQ